MTDKVDSNDDMDEDWDWTEDDDESSDWADDDDEDEKDKDEGTVVEGGDDDVWNPDEWVPNEDMGDDVWNPDEWTPNEDMDEETHDKNQTQKEEDLCNPEPICNFTECRDWEILSPDFECWREDCFSECGDQSCTLWHYDGQYEEWISEMCFEEPVEPNPLDQVGQVVGAFNNTIAQVLENFVPANASLPI